MHIKFQVSGGFGGLFAALPLTLAIDDAELPQPDRDKLLTLLGEAKLLEQVGASEAARDTYQYRLEIEDGAANRVHTFDDVSAPATVRPLLQFLQKLAVQQRAAD